MAKNGDSTADIDQKTDPVILAKDSVDNPDDTATDADIIRHQDDGGIKVGFDNQNRMYLYSHKGTMQWILGGFPPGGRTRLKSRFRDFAQSELSRGRRQCVPLLLRWRTMDPDRSCRCCSARG